MPVPDSDFEANLVKSFGFMSGWIPVPLSVTFTLATLPSWVFSADIVMDPDAVNLTAVCARSEMEQDAAKHNPKTNI